MSFDSDDDGRAFEKHERRIKRCPRAGCHAKVIWFRTPDGRNTPVDADTVEVDDNNFEPERHVVHWPECRGRVGRG